uniref:G_PROTEIN_RECEP_F1_2 domain-containing protein n=1 Tax=Parascaris univalens TaxID=6257 RepID=A0A914ZPE5_PARUN
IIMLIIMIAIIQAIVIVILINIIVNAIIITAITDLSYQHYRKFEIDVLEYHNILFAALSQSMAILVIITSYGNIPCDSSFHFRVESIPAAQLKCILLTRHILFILSFRTFFLIYIFISTFFAASFFLK